MKLKKLLTITLGIGSCLCLLSCGDNKEKESSSESKTESSTIVESSKEEIQSSSTNNQESSLNTESSETVESQNETSSLIESSSDVSDEWTLITYEELCDYFENKDESNYNFLMISTPIDNKANYEYQKIENGKYYVSSFLNETVDIYNYDFKWKEVSYLEVMAPDKLNFFSQATKNDKGYYVSENGIYKFEKNTNNYKITIYDLDMNVIDISILDKYFNMIEDERDFVKHEDGHISSVKTVITWETVDLTKVNGHIEK